MLLIQAVLALLRKSLGSALRAIFGWATLALFGEVAEKDRTLLTAAVAAAGLWPLMLLGSLLPRTAAFLLTFVPIPRGAPASLVRALWIALTVAIPIGVGFVIRRRAREGSPIQGVRDVLAGFPVTLGLGAAFLLACVTVPIRKIAAMASGRKEEHVALVIPTKDYAPVAAQLREALNAGGVDAVPMPPPWTTRALSRTMRVLGGSLLGTYLPENLVFLKGPDLQATVYPNGVRILGPQRVVARSHALIAECATRTAALQTMGPDAQKLEERIKALRREREDGADVEARARSLALRLADADLSYEDWETLQRQILQLVVELRGGGELLQRAAGGKRAGTRSHRRRAGS